MLEPYRLEDVDTFSNILYVIANPNPHPNSNPYPNSNPNPNPNPNPIPNPNPNPHQVPTGPGDNQP